MSVKEKVLTTYYRIHTLLQTLLEPVWVELVEAVGILGGLAAETVLNGDLAAILLTQQRADNSALQPALISTHDEVGYLEDGQRVQHDLQARIGRLLGRQQLVGCLAGHGSVGRSCTCRLEGEGCERLLCGKWRNQKMGDWRFVVVGRCVGREVVAGLVDKAEVQPCRWSWELGAVLGSGARSLLGGAELFADGGVTGSCHACLVSSHLQGDP